MKKTPLCCTTLLLASVLTACSTLPHGEDGIEVEIGVGCTEDIVSYQKELKKLLKESEDQEAEKRLQQIIEYVECNEETENNN